jgi:solute carrier family 35 protein C2
MPAISLPYAAASASSSSSNSRASPIPTPSSPTSADGSSVATDNPLSRNTRPAPADTAATSTSTQPSIVTSWPAGQDIEMEPVNNHRRRKNSLVSPITGNNAGPSTLPNRPRAQSLRTPQSDEPRISEEPELLDDSILAKDDQSHDDSSDDDLHDDEETGLTRGERTKRQKRRRKNTLLDQRIAREKSVSPSDRKEAEKSIVWTLAVNCMLILLWYLFSLSISLVCGRHTRFLCLPY